MPRFNRRLKIRRSSAAAMLAVVLAIAGCAAQSGPDSLGWSLMLPPLTDAGFADKDAPLPQWQTIGTFGSQVQCTSVMQSRQFAMHAQYGPITQAQSAYQGDAVRMLSAQCVAAGDPRLKPAQ